jgi:hypothetical protein
VYFQDLFADFAMRVALTLVPGLLNTIMMARTLAGAICGSAATLPDLTISRDRHHS